MIVLKIIFITLLIILDAIALFYLPRDIRKEGGNPLWILGVIAIASVELVLIFWLVTVVYAYFYGVSPWG